MRSIDTSPLFNPSPLLPNPGGPDGAFSSYSPFLSPFHDELLAGHGTSIPNAPCPLREDGREENQTDGHLATIEQLSRLNLVLYKHIANMDTANDDHRPASVIPTPPDDASAISTPPPTNLDLGHLLSMTHEFKTLADELGLQFPGVSPRTAGTNIGSPHAPFDHSTALLLLSCYMRLKQAHGRAQRVLRGLLERQAAGDRRVPELLPELVVDGFALSGQAGLQVGVAVALCEQMFNSLGHLAFDGRSADDMDWLSFGACLTEKLQEIG